MVIQRPTLLTSSWHFHYFFTSNKSPGRNKNTFRKRTLSSHVTNTNCLKNERHVRLLLDFNNHCCRQNSTPPQDHCQQCHPHIHATLCLPEVSSPWVCVKLWRDLLVAGQWVKHDHAALGSGHEVWSDDEVTTSLGSEIGSVVRLWSLLFVDHADLVYVLSW